MWSAAVSVMLVAAAVSVLQPSEAGEPSSYMTTITREELMALRLLRGGAVYTRWGRDECPQNGTELLYAGYAAGSFFTATGGGSNYLCLPTDPEWGKYNDAAEGTGLIWGAEYQMHSAKLDGSTGVSDVYDHDVPCAVCLSTRASAVVMVPAKRTCLKGWFLEYTGYLASTSHAQKGRTEFVCLDARPAANASGKANTNGALFYTVEGRCGALPCPPYVNGRELTCVVCTK